MNASDFGKVAVLMGGTSAEREISLKSGRAVLAALGRKGIDAHMVDADRSVLTVLAQGGYQRAFIALHGRGGEDGTLQGALEVMGIPYTGSGVLASALGMDKLRCKQLWTGCGVPVPPWRELRNDADLTEAAKLGFPLMIKPSREGSSLGMTKVRGAEQLEAAWREALRFDQDVFAERCIVGPEYTAAILGADTLPLIRVETPREFYDYDAKYFTDTTSYVCPCGLDADAERRLQDLARHAYDLVGCRGWGRVDFMLDERGDPFVLEVNTVPGMTDHSLVPMAAAQAGIGFDDLVVRILEGSREPR